MQKLFFFIFHLKKFFHNYLSGNYKRIAELKIHCEKLNIKDFLVSMNKTTDAKKKRKKTISRISSNKTWIEFNFGREKKIDDEFQYICIIMEK